MPESFEAKVESQIERLKRSSGREIEKETAQKRIAWLAQNQPAVCQKAHPGPRQAFEALFFDYMGIPADELPVLSESADEIVWHSLNPCPTLAAVQQLGLDTRRVCRASYEKSTQAFISRLDPQLRFLRSYAEIRPYSGYCKEMIVRIDFDDMMRVAIEEAKVSKQQGNKGYGAVVVLGHEIIGKAHDTAVTEHDPSRHAEVNAIRQAVQAMGDSNLSGAILFSTCEPCPMCSSLAVWANLTSVVFGASIEETAAMGKSRIRISAKEIVERSPVMIEVIGGVLGEECRSLYE
ncbi:MAG TPA: nucleoside deaminase [Anaerolineales bacterium]|nr:nucleoside deaminase [Anaerolineales bacterium]